MVVPQKHPKNESFFSRKNPWFVGYHHFRKPPCMLYTRGILSESKLHIRIHFIKPLYMFDSIVRKSIVYVSSFSQSVGEIQMLAHVGSWHSQKSCFKNLWFQSFWSLDVGKNYPKYDECFCSKARVRKTSFHLSSWTKWHCPGKCRLAGTCTHPPLSLTSFPQDKSWQNPSNPKTCHPQSYLLIQGAEPTHLRAMEKLPDKSTVCKVFYHEAWAMPPGSTRHHQTILFFPNLFYIDWTAN